tara:strand:- start:1963 stop:3168 length:1206 start_codon:yes stop_codon:yes gene_type:complete
MNRVALAFSGGLDTTVCVSLLKEEYGYDDVIGITVNVGQPKDEFEQAIETANALSLELHIIDATEDFADLCLDSVRANATYQGYPLGTALARPIIANSILETAQQNDCKALAHGCTGKGNDQLRFEAIWRGSDLKIAAPIRDLGLTRDWEINYAKENDLPVKAGNSGVWSIDTNLWSRSIEGGELENSSTVPPSSIYEWTNSPSSNSKLITIDFIDGFPVSVDNQKYSPVDLIKYLNDLCGPYGVGRTDIMEDRILGLKVRENYEHPAATALLNAHLALEDLVLTKAERKFKKLVDDAWSEQAYMGLVYSPLMEALNSFISSTQKRVTGSVTLDLQGGQARAVARESPFSAHSATAASFNTSEVLGDITQIDAIGVAKYHGLQERMASAIIAANNSKNNPK